MDQADAVFKDDAKTEAFLRVIHDLHNQIQEKKSSIQYVLLEVFFDPCIRGRIYYQHPQR